MGKLAHAIDDQGVEFSLCQEKPDGVNVHR
jgi:hypothetical protein